MSEEKETNKALKEISDAIYVLAICVLLLTGMSTCTGPSLHETNEQLREIVRTMKEAIP